MENQENKLTREFRLTSWSLQNKNTIFLLSLIVVVFGAISYISLPKELFPEVNWPTILVQTTYPGNSPADIENLITRPIEKELKTLKGMNKLTSISAQDASMIFVEFTTNTDIEEALQDVKDGVDKAKSNLPNDEMMFDPVVMDFDFSEFPILFVNLSGDYSIAELEEYAEYLQDEIETIFEISKVEIKGLDEREVEISVDMHKLEAFDLSLMDIETAVISENLSMSGGDIKMGKTRQAVRIVGEFKNAKEINDIVVKNEDGNIVYMRDVATVTNGYAEPKSFARLNKKSVVSLQVVKKSGENIVSAAQQTFAKIAKARTDGAIPEDLTISITNDTSKQVDLQLQNLENSMIIGMIFVIGILFFFLGLRNALFVGIAIPMSMFLSMAILGMMGATINMMVLFSLILALGMLVDNAIVAVENIYRFISQGHSIAYSAKHAVGEIAVPIISSTATTLAAFFPLIFWNDIMGEFMKYLPITLIIILTASLFVALVIIPVVAAAFIVIPGQEKPLNKRKNLVIAAVAVVLAILLYVARQNTMANLLAILAILIVAILFFLARFSKWFQVSFLTQMEFFYFRVIRYVLRGRRPQYSFIGMFVLLFVVLIFFGIREPNVMLFPENEPQYINIITEMPIGTDVTATDSLVKNIEDYIFEVLEPYKSVVENVLSTVGEGVGRDNEFAVGVSPNKSKITINFVDFEYRDGVSTSFIMKLLTEKLNENYTGIEFFIEKNSSGPPTGFPINIEISGKDIDKLIHLTENIQTHIEQSGIKGIEGLKMDIETGKPELLVEIDRERARRFGLSTYSIANTIRTALYGKDISDFKEGEDEYPIYIRLDKKYRYNLATLMNQQITFRNNMGKLMQIPISSVAKIETSSTFGSIRRKDMNRVVTLYSNPIEGYNANVINNEIKDLLSNYDMPIGYSFSFTGEQEEQNKTFDFLVRALLIAISLILIILVTQFNSIVKPFIIIASVFFSTIGVFGGIATFKMDFVILMTGIGIISLAGVVVNNAIVLIDYIDFLKSSRKKELGMDESENLPISEIIPCIIQGGKTRLRPVLLTAITTVLGLLPMAMGVNINFATLMSDFDPQFYMGGDNAEFWGPMSWAVIFGLVFATFLTLIVVPTMYLLANKLKLSFVGSVRVENGIVYRD